LFVLSTGASLSPVICNSIVLLHYSTIGFLKNGILKKYGMLTKKYGILTKK
jgi:hypothetical protein